MPVLCRPGACKHPILPPIQEGAGASHAATESGAELGLSAEGAPVPSSHREARLHVPDGFGFAKAQRSPGCVGSQRKQDGSGTRRTCSPGPPPLFRFYQSCSLGPKLVRAGLHPAHVAGAHEQPAHLTGLCDSSVGSLMVQLSTINLTNK